MSNFKTCESKQILFYLIFFIKISGCILMFNLDNCKLSKKKKKWLNKQCKMLNENSFQCIVFKLYGKKLFENVF